MDFLFLFFYHLSHKGSPRILEWVAIPLLQGIFPTQGPNQRVPHCRKVLHYLSHQGSPTYRGRGCLSCPVSFFILCAAPLEIWLDLILFLLSPVPYRFSSCVLEIWLDPIQSALCLSAIPIFPLLSSSFSTTWLISLDTACRQNPQPPPHSTPEKASELDTGFQPPPVDLSFG